MIGSTAIGQPTDLWFYHRASDRVGVIVNGVKFTIWPDTLGVMGNDWVVSNAPNSFPFKKQHQLPYAELPAWFQAAAPQWKQRFAAATNKYHAVRAQE